MGGAVIINFYWQVTHEKMSHKEFMFSWSGIIKLTQKRLASKTSISINYLIFLEK